MRRAHLLAMASILTLLATASGSAADAAKAKVQDTTVDRPNVLVIMTDDQRADTMSYMPQVSSMGGTTFEEAHASTSICCPGRSALLTGRYSHNTGIWTNKGAAELFADDVDQTLATWLDAAGYRTAWFGKYFNQWGQKEAPPGWDAFVPQPGFMWGTTYHVDAIADRATAFMHSDETPFFVVASVRPPHAAGVGDDGLPGYPPTPPPGTVCPEYEPWRPPSWNLPPEKAAEMDAFRAGQLCSLEAIDGTLRALIDAAPQDTVVVFTSDNGYMWGEHGYITKGVHWDEATRIPLIVRMPGAQTQTTGAVAGGIDIAPTILDAVGLPIPGIVDGRSQLPVITGSLASVRDTLLIEHNGPKVVSGGIRTQDALYLAEPAEALYVDEWQMFDVSADPAYASDLARLRAAFRSARDCIGAECAGDTPHVVKTPDDNWATWVLPTLADAVAFAEAKNARHRSTSAVVIRQGDGEFYVDGALSIQAAVDAAMPGDTINVLRGTYDEAVVVGTPVTLVGTQAGVSPLGLKRAGEATLDDSDESIVRAPDGQDAFRISASNVSVDGFLLTSENAGLGADGMVETAALHGTAISNVRVSGLSGLGIVFAAGSSHGAARSNLIEDVRAGVYVSSSAHDITVYGNTIRDLAGSGSPDGAAVVLEGANRAVSVMHNVLTGNVQGVFIGAGDDLTGTALNRNTIVANVEDVANDSGTMLDAECNWWGSSSGPPGEALVAGYSARLGLDVDPWLHTDDLTAACPIRGMPDGKIAKASATGPFKGDGVYLASPSPDQTQRQLDLAAGTVVRFWVVIENDGLRSDSFTVHAAEKGSDRIAVAYIVAGVNVTSEVVAGTYTTGSLEPGTQQVMVLRVTVAADAALDARRVAVVSATSAIDPTAIDVVRAVAGR